MIVRRDGSDWLLITQPDHAALAGRIMSAWRGDGFPDRPTRARVLDATARHDIGWTAEDAAPGVNPDGDPYDFVSAPLDVRQRLWPRALDLLAADDLYVAALVAQHAITVYRRYSSDPAWRGFFTLLEQRRDDLFADSAERAPAASVAASAATAGAAPHTQPAPASFSTFLLDYTIVGLGDMFSLIFCNGWREPYLIEGYHAILRDDRLTIAPDPFEGATVALDVAARRIPVRPYASDQDLRDTLAQAPTVRLSGLATGAALPPIT
jgi:hypothetical protein